MSFPGGVISGNILPSNTGQDLGSASQRWDAYIQTLNVAGFGGVAYADQFSGVDAGAKIANAITQLTSGSGGTVDARGFGATVQTISSTITVGDAGHPVRLLLDSSTVFKPSGDSINMFNLGANSEIDGLFAYLADRPAYTGTVVTLQDQYTDGYKTQLKNVRIDAAGVVGGKGIYVQGTNTSTQRVPFVSFNHIRIIGLSRGIHLKSSGSGWVNGNHFSDVQISDSVIGVELESTSATGGSTVEGNIFNGLSIQHGSHMTAGIKLNSSAGFVRYNQFIGLDIWDTTAVPPIQVSGTGAVDNLLVGRWDGTYSDALRQNNYISLLGGIFDFAGLSPWFNNDAHINDTLYVGGNSPSITLDGNTGTATATVFSGAHNGTVGATTPSTGAFTTLSAGSAKTTLDANGLVTKYNNVTTAGNGLSAVVAVTSQKAETAADTNVLTLTPPAAAGTYRVNIVLSLSAANTATLGWTMTWKDSNGNAQSPTNLALFQTGTAAPALTFTTSAASNYHGSAVIDIDNSATAIVVKTTFSGTSFAGKASATIERIQ